MQIVEKSQPFTFNYVSIDRADDLPVAFEVWDVTTGTAVFVDAIAGASIGNGSYIGSFESSAEKTFLIIGAVFTDGSFTTPDLNYSPDAESYQVAGFFLSTLAFTYGTYDQAEGLAIRAAVYDFSTGSPVFVQNIVLTLVSLGVYLGIFNGSVQHTYAIESVVYTSGSFLTVDLNRLPSCDNFTAFQYPDVIVENVLDEAILVGQSTEAILEGNCA